MELKDLLLVIIAGLNFLLGLYVYSKNFKSKLRLSFFCLTVAISLWCITLPFSLQNVFDNEIIVLSFARLAYFAAAAIAVTFLFFAYKFPLEIPIKKNIFYPFLSGFAILSLILVSWPNFIIQRIMSRSWGYEKFYNPLGYVIFSFFFLFYMSVGFYFMIKRYIISDGANRINLKLVLMGFGVGAIFGVIFNLILPFGGYWQLTWVGPYFSLVMIFYVGRMIFRK